MAICDGRCDGVAEVTDTGHDQYIITLGGTTAAHYALKTIIVHGDPEVVWVDTYSRDKNYSTYAHLTPDEAEMLGMILIRAAQATREKTH